MLIRRFVFIIFTLLFISTAAFSQTGSSKTGAAKSVPPGAGSIKTSAAYIELVIHKADIDAELVDLLVEYTEEYPKVKQLKWEAGLVQAELENLLKVDSSVLPKLTESFAKLLLQKIKMQVDLAEVRSAHKDDHPDVQRAMRRVEIYDKAIKELLQ
jgi:hypothetical protein